MKRAPPPKLFATRATYVERKEAFESFLSDPQNALDPAIQELESLYEHKIAHLQECLRKAERERDDTRCERDEAVLGIKRELLAAHEQAAEALAEEREKHQEEKDKWDEYLDYVKRHYETSAKQVEEEHAFEVAQLHARQEELQKSQVDKSFLEKRTKQIVELKREVDVLRQELQQQKQEFLAQMNDKEIAHRDNLEQRTRALRESNEALTKTVSDKTLECMRLAKEAERVANERNIIQYQLAESNEQHGPLDRSIAMLQEQVEAYESERLKNIDAIKALKRRIEDQANREKVLQREAQQHKRTTQAREKVIHAFSQQIFDLIFSEGDRSEDAYKQAILGLYDRFVKGTENERRFGDPDLGLLDEDVPASVAGARLPSLEFSRQREALQRMADCMSKNARRARTKLSEHRRKATTENVKMLSENKSLRRRVVALENELSETRAAAVIERSTFKAAQRRAAAQQHHEQRRAATTPPRARTRPSLAPALPAPAAHAAPQRRPSTTGPPEPLVSSTDYALRRTLRPPCKGS